MFVKHAFLAIALIAVPTTLLAQTQSDFDAVLERVINLDFEHPGAEESQVEQPSVEQPPVEQPQVEQSSLDHPIDLFAESLIWDRLADCKKSVMPTPECIRLDTWLPVVPLSLEEFNAVWADVVIEGAKRPRRQLHPLEAEFERSRIKQVKTGILRTLKDSLLSDPDPETVAAEMTRDELHLAVAKPALRDCAINTRSGKDLLPLVDELISKWHLLRQSHSMDLLYDDAIPKAIFAADNARAICKTALRRFREALPDLVAAFKKRVAQTNRNDFICGGYRAARAYALRVPGGREDSRVRDEDPGCVAYYRAYRNALLANAAAADAAKTEADQRNRERLLQNQLIQ